MDIWNFSLCHLCLSKPEQSRAEQSRKNRAKQTQSSPLFNQIHPLNPPQLSLPLSHTSISIFLSTYTPLSHLSKPLPHLTFPPLQSIHLCFSSGMADTNATNASKRPTGSLNINDDADVLLEILTRLDDRSLGVAACVCRLWCSITRNDAFWEMLCFRNATPPARVRHVVVALGGYKKLYMVCVRRVMGRLGTGMERGWTREEVQLSLSLFCVDCYERLGGKKGGGGGGEGGGGDGLMTAATPSLMFLYEPVNV